MQVSQSAWAIRPIHWPCGDDRGYISWNKVMMNFQTSTKSANERTYFITEQENNKIRNYFERTSVQIVEFIFLFFIDFWRIFHDATHQIFKILLASVSFLLMLRDRYALLQPIFDTVACQLVKGWYRLFDIGILILGTLIWACTQI